MRNSMHFLRPCFAIALTIPAIASASELKRVDTLYPSAQAKGMVISDTYRFTRSDVRACKKGYDGHVEVLLSGFEGRQYDRFTKNNVGNKVRIKFSALELGQYIVEEKSKNGLIMLNDATGYEKTMLDFCLGGSRQYRRIN